MSKLNLWSNKKHWRQAPNVEDKEFIHESLDDIDQVKQIVKVVNDDVIEITSYHNGRRWKWLIIFFVVFLGVFGTHYIKHAKIGKGSTSIIPSEVWFALDRESYANWYIHRLETRSYKGTYQPKLTEDEKLGYRNRMLSFRKEKGDKSDGIKILIITFFPLLMWLLPARRGIRVDRKRQLIYSHSWGRFYGYRPQANLIKLPMYFVSANCLGVKNTASGSLAIGLNKLGQLNKFKFFELGRSPSIHHHQPQLIQKLMDDYLFAETTPTWVAALSSNASGKKCILDRLATIANFSILKAPWPRNIDQKIEAYLTAQHGENEIKQPNIDALPVDDLKPYSVGFLWFVILANLILIGVAGAYTSFAYSEFRSGDIMGMLGNAFIAFGALTMWCSIR